MLQDGYDELAISMSSKKTMITYHLHIHGDCNENQSTFRKSYLYLLAIQYVLCRIVKMTSTFMMPPLLAIKR